MKYQLNKATIKYRFEISPNDFGLKTNNLKIN